MSRQQQNNKDRAVAALLTMLCVLLILLGLFFGSVRWDRSLLAEASTPEIMEDVPIYFEPMIIPLGEEASTADDAPAEAASGSPIPAETPQARMENTGTDKTSAPVSPVAEGKPDVKPDLKNSEKERQEATDAVTSVFGTGTGNVSSSSSSSGGAGGDGEGVYGSAQGRSFISCPLPDVSLRHLTIVKVYVIINSEGNVIEAKASGAPNASIRKKCEEAAMRAKWSKKAGASDARGSITFRIIPR